MIFPVSPVFVFISTSRCYELRAAQEFVQKSQAVRCQHEDISSWISARFILGSCSSFSSNNHITFFGFKVKPQQAAENKMHVRSFMIHAWRLSVIAWFHLSSSSTQWHSCRGFPTPTTQILTFGRWFLNSQLCQCSVDTPSFLLWTQSHIECNVFTGVEAPTVTHLKRQSWGTWHCVVVALTAYRKSSYCPERIHRSLINSIPFKEEVRNWGVPLFQ